MHRNPFNVMDVPEPNDRDVKEFAASATLNASADDNNADAWAVASNRPSSVEGVWCSRWNGGADPTIPGDTKDKWKQGQGDVRLAEDRIYLLFDWDHGVRKGLIDARRDGAKLVGKYINLTDPTITRPWIGVIVNNQRIDGCWTGGRLDFRR